MYDKEIVLIDFIAPRYHSVCFNVISEYDEMFLLLGLLLMCVIITTSYLKKDSINKKTNESKNTFEDE